MICVKVHLNLSTLEASRVVMALRLAMFVKSLDVNVAWDFERLANRIDTETARAIALNVKYNGKDENTK